MKIYGSYLCKDCISVKEELDKLNINYEFIDILASLSSLKEFLHLRDTLNIFDDVKKSGFIGIPLILKDDLTYTINPLDLGIELKENTSQSCDILNHRC